MEKIAKDDYFSYQEFDKDVLEEMNLIETKEIERIVNDLLDVIDEKEHEIENLKDEIEKLKERLNEENY